MSYKYDTKGNILEELGSGEDGEDRKISTYNDNNMLLTEESFIKDDSDEWIPEEKTIFSWDEVIKDYFTSRMGYNWEADNSAWVENYRCQTNEVTRNGDGNIIEIISSMPLNGEMVPGYRTVWTYGTDGQANAMTPYANETNPIKWYIQEGVSYKNIVWETTNGQLTSSDLTDYVSGENRLKSADIYYEDELDGKYVIEYIGTNSDYVFHNQFVDGDDAETLKNEVIDVNGSLRMTYISYLDGENHYSASPTYIETVTVMIDDHGNVTSEIAKEQDFGEEPYETEYGPTYDYTYDEKGNPTEVIESMVQDGESMPFMRTVYGEYIDVTKDAGIGNVAVAEKNVGPAAVYNAQGIRVATVADAAELNQLPAGLYIFGGRKYVVR